MEVRTAGPGDRPWMEACCRRAFGGPVVASLGRVIDPAVLPALVAWEGPHRVGTLAYQEEPGGAEVVLLVADPPGRGAGSALLAALRAEGLRRKWGRLRLLTTNDNLATLGFCQRRGWDLVRLHRGAVDRDRLLKPAIPAVGASGIPIRHALELELRLVPLEGEEP